jgi:hypothetical protein
MINSSSDAAGTDLAKRPEMTPEERAVLSAHIARRKQKRPSPRVKLVEKAGSSIELSADHPIPHLGNALIMESLGTADFDFYDGLLLAEHVWSRGNLTPTTQHQAGARYWTSSWNWIVSGVDPGVTRRSCCRISKSNRSHENGRIHPGALACGAPMFQDWHTGKDHLRMPTGETQPASGMPHLGN